MRPSAALLAIAILLATPQALGATVATVDLGSAGSFAVLAGAGITNTGATTIRGDVGSHPTSAQTGFGPGANSVTLIGASTNHHDDAVTQDAKEALVVAYEDAEDRPLPTPIVGGELGGLTLPPGVYADDDAPDSLQITGTLTLDGLGDPDSVFIFQSGSTLITASNSDVVLTGGAQACNIFWQVTSSATLGTGSHVEGTILALTSITLDTSATLNGRALARNGAVTMDTNTIQVVPCASATPMPDLVVDDIEAEGSRFNATVTNLGNEGSGPFVVHFDVDGVPLGDRTVPALAAGATIEIMSDDWTPTEGDHSITVTADHGEDVAESDEGNNARTERFEIPGTEVPFFPSTMAAVVAGVALLGGFLLLRRRVGGRP